MASIQQHLIIGFLRLTRRKRLWEDPDRLLADAREQHLKGPATPPEKLGERVNIAVDHSLGFPVYTLAPKPAGERHAPAVARAMYVHGGGYIHDFGPAHFKFMTRLVERTGLTITAPGYPLAPEHTWRDCYQQIVSLARMTMADQEAPLLLGDSAGAGFALSIAQALAADGQHPDAVLLSPYGDATVSQPETPRYDHADPYLSAVGVRTALTAWAGRDDPRRPEVSPLFGEFSGLRRLLIFTGTRDTIHPQSRLIAEKSHAYGAHCELVVAPGCIHVYPLMPIPEGKRAMDKIVGFLNATTESNVTTRSAEPPAPAQP